MGRIVFRSLLQFVVLVAAAAKDIPISSSYVIRHTDSCPDVGYYFRREPAPNSIDPGPCLLCFCQTNGTAACWIRESKRCDVEKYHLHRFGRETRVRRSPIGLGDIFFRDATKDFFDKKLPGECKPLKESFSDGCPPADWCAGCTVCDCDANGRWDCHILSFCNDVERKKIDGVKIPPPKSRKTGKKSGNRPLKNQKVMNKKPTPRPKRRITPKPVKKTDKPGKKAIKKEIRRVIRKVNNNENKTQKISPKRRRIIIKKKANNEKIKQKRENPNQTDIKDIVIKKEIATHNPMTISNMIVKGIPPFNLTNSEYQLGQILVKRVMSSVQKLVQNELDKLNKTMEKLQDTRDCEEIMRLNQMKRISSNEIKNKKSGEEFLWRRNKRDVSQQPVNSNYDNSTDPTTANKTVLETSSTSAPNRRNLTRTPNLPLHVPNPTSAPLNISQKNNNFTKVDSKDVNNDTSNHELVVKPVNNTSNDINTVLNEKKEKYINFVIAVENDTAFNETKSINTTKLNNITEVIPVIYNANLSRIAIIENYKYNIDNSSTEKSKVIATTSTTNTPIKEKKSNNVYEKLSTKAFEVPKRFPLKKIIKKKFKDLASIYFPLHEILNQKKPYQRLFLVKHKSMAKKNSTQKIKTKFNYLKYIKKIFNKIFFGKKKEYLQQNDDEYQILRIICENINACNINRQNRNILKNKIKKINVESNNIFKTMKIIKGLLHLIDIPNITNTSDFKDDIRKLHVILKDNSDNFSQNMSDTQKTQIKYVKQNTVLFTASVTRFTELLSEIIIILQKNKQETRRSFRNRYVNNKNKNLTEAFAKIQKLLIKHNLVENTFIKQIYNMLNDVKKKLNPNMGQVSRKQVNSKVIEYYSKSIIENLRKLKGLAHALNSSRKKREVLKEDDTFEYLLLLMEYLIKKDHPIPKEPVNDGIDLLIDTIKSAPDINSIKKKVIENLSASSSDDSSYESNSISKDTNISQNSDDVNNAEDMMIRESYEKRVVNSMDYYDNLTNVPLTPVVTIAPVKDKEDKTDFDKLESFTTDSKTYDTFVIDEEETDARATNDVLRQSETSETTPLAEPFLEFLESTTVKTIYNQSGDSLGNLEWIEENFGNELREIGRKLYVTNETESSTPISDPITTTSTKAPVQIVDNGSDISDENIKKQKEMSAEEVMRRKEMDLLNSLDYGTPKSDFDDTKSEDDEKFNSEAYF